MSGVKGMEKKKHYGVYMSNLPEWVEVGKADVVFHIFKGEKKLGRLLVSKGGVEWMPFHKSQNGHPISWREFIERMK
jgi:hypothetical protein